MAIFLLLTVAIHAALAAIDLPHLWHKPERTRERWLTMGLWLLSLGLATITALGYRPLSAWRLIGALLSPIGLPLFGYQE